MAEIVPIDGSGWLLIEREPDRSGEREIHVLPVRSQDKHRLEAATCVCSPVVELYPNGILIIHAEFQ